MRAVRPCAPAPRAAMAKAGKAMKPKRVARVVKASNLVKALRALKPWSPLRPKSWSKQCDCGKWWHGKDELNCDKQIRRCRSTHFAVGAADFEEYAHRDPCHL